MSEYFAWRACTLEIKPAPSLEPEEEGVETRTQSVSRHMVQSGQFDVARRLRNARWQFILPVTVCRSRLLVPQSIPGEQWRLLETDSSYTHPPPLLHHHRSLIDPALLCIPINWTEGEAAVCRITSKDRHILLASFQSLYPSTINSAVLPFSLPCPLFSDHDKGQLFQEDNS